MPQKTTGTKRPARSKAAAAPLERRLEYVAMSELMSAPRNPKRHDTEGIAQSIGAHGFVEPVILDERTGRLVGGHGRLDSLFAAREAGAEAPEGIIVEGDEWLVPSILGWSSRSDEDAEHLLVALNRLPESGGWDRRGLFAILDSLAASEMGLAGTGYSPQDLAAMQAELKPVEAPESFEVIDPAEVTIDHKCPRCGYEWSGRAKLPE